MYIVGYSKDKLIRQLALRRKRKCTEQMSRARALYTTLLQLMYKHMSRYSQYFFQVCEVRDWPLQQRSSGYRTDDY